MQDDGVLSCEFDSELSLDAAGSTPNMQLLVFQAVPRLREDFEIDCGLCQCQLLRQMQEATRAAAAHAVVDVQGCLR